MTTSRETDWMNHPVLRRLVDEVNTLTLDERLTLIKGLIPSIAADMTPKAFEAFAVEIGLKGERFYDAKHHPGQGKSSRHVLGERDLEGR